MRQVQYKSLALLGMTIFLLGALAIPRTRGVQASQASPDSYASALPQTTTGQTGIVGNDVCLSCHGQTGIQPITLENGDILDLYVDPQVYGSSIHGQLGYACEQCHVGIGNFPHPEFNAADLRDAQLQLYQACQRCHSGEYTRTQDSVHASALNTDMREAAICTDCHTAHAVRQLTDPATHELLPESHLWIPQTCAQCHSAIYEKYQTSVHGAALIDEENQDVPTCIDCHGVHDIANPTTNGFRVNSPLICAECHTNPEIMGRYGISTDVLSTYVADFHGTTVTLFEHTDPDAETNKPVCFDCHGIHDIQATGNPETGLQVRSNLLARCQTCHPDATANFPDAWLSHYIPSAENTPAVYYVNLFYKFFIPATLGGMALLVILDFSSKVGRKLRGASHPHAVEEVKHE